VTKIFSRRAAKGAEGGPFHSIDDPNQNSLIRPYLTVSRSGWRHKASTRRNAPHLLRKTMFRVSRGRAGASESNSMTLQRSPSSETKDLRR
jgi:hypothetical protein